MTTREQRKKYKQKKRNMIVDVTGYGYSGSGAMIDLLKEYDDLYYSRCFSGELAFLHNVDGVSDLEYKLCRKQGHVLDSDIAVKRFFHLIDKYYDREKAFRGKLSPIARKYVMSLGGITYVSHSGYDKTYFYTNKLILSAAWNKIVKKLTGGKFGDMLRVENMNTKYLVVNPKNFCSATQQFMDAVINIFREETTFPLVTDHLLPPEQPQNYFKYIGERVKSIVVWRDPRDTYILAKAIYKGRIPVPCDNAEDFCWYYRNKIADSRQNKADDVLVLRFEDLIYNYETTRKTIEDYLDISRHTRKREYFNPARSVVNTCLYQRYPVYERDISVIQSNLADCLFPYEEYSLKPDSNAKVF